MPEITLFPFDEYVWVYAAFVVFLLGALALDLGVFHRQAHEVRYREAFGWVVTWVSLALLFCVGLYFYAGWWFPQDPRLVGLDHGALARQVALQFLTGYVVEQSLSMDNVFVFAVVFNYFAIPLKYQHRVLFYGILGALVFRSVFIALGSALIQYHWVEWIFGAFLVFTGLRIMMSSEAAIDPEKNWIIRMLRRVIPVTPQLEGQRFLVRQAGKWVATPLMVCLVFLEITDVIFAIDSVPAIFAITREPLIVFTSNLFAIMGLRAMYFLLAGLVEQFRYLKYGLGIVLVFVGLKMVWLNDAFGGKFPIQWSLAIIVGVIGLSILLSFAIRPKVHPPEAREG